MTKWKLIYIAALVGLGAISVWWMKSFVSLTFKDVSAQSIANILAPVLVIATFLERAQEVFIKAWRNLRRRELEEDQAKAQKALDAAQTAADKKTAQQVLHEAEQAVITYRGETARLAFIAGATGGILIAIAGVRTLWPLIDSPDLIQNATQSRLFNTVDIFLTGGLLAGGSDGIHKAMTVITDGLTRWREQINTND